MKLLFCNYEYPPLGGGGGVLTADLARELSKRHDVTVLTSAADGYGNEETDGNVRVVRVPVSTRRERAAANIVSMAQYVFKGRQIAQALARRDGFDLVNSFFVLPTGPVGQAAARSGDVPHIISALGADIYDPSKTFVPHRFWLLRKLTASLLRDADAVTVESRNLIHYMEKIYSSDFNAHLIPLGINRPPPPKRTRADFGFSSDELLLVALGRLVSRKAVDQLLHSMKDLADANARLVIVGDGPQEMSLKTLAGELGVADRVTFVGHVDESAKYDLLHASDIFVTTTQHEGFGLVFLEGMACGLPVVCYDEGGHTDFLTHQSNAMIARLNNRAEWVDYCRRLISNAQIRDKMSSAALKSVEPYLMDQCAETYVRLYEQTIENPGRRLDRKSRTPA